MDQFGTALMLLGKTLKSEAKEHTYRHTQTLINKINNNRADDTNGLSERSVYEREDGCHTLTIIHRISGVFANKETRGTQASKD